MIGVPNPPMIALAFLEMVTLYQSMNSKFFPRESFMLYIRMVCLWHVQVLHTLNWGTEKLSHGTVVTCTGYEQQECDSAAGSEQQK